MIRFSMYGQVECTFNLNANNWGITSGYSYGYAWANLVASTANECGLAQSNAEEVELAGDVDEDAGAAWTISISSDPGGSGGYSDSGADLKQAAASGAAWLGEGYMAAKGAFIKWRHSTKARSGISEYALLATARANVYACSWSLGPEESP